MSRCWRRTAASGAADPPRRAARGVRADFLYEVQGGPRPPGLAAVADKPRRRASSRRPSWVPAGGRTQARAGLNLVPAGVVVSVESLRVAQQVVAYDRPTAGSQAQGRPGRPFTSVTGLTEGGGQRHLRRGTKLPAPHHRPTPPRLAPEHALGRSPRAVPGAAHGRASSLGRRPTQDPSTAGDRADQNLAPGAASRPGGRADVAGPSACPVRRPGVRPLPVPDPTPGRPRAQDPASTCEDRRTHVRRSAPWGEARCQRGSAPVCLPR